MNSAAQSPQFILLLRHPPGRLPDAELAPIMEKFAVWMKSIGERGELAGTNGLGPAGKVLRGPGGAEITDGPYPEAKEIVGGYILLHAPDLAAATAIARGCPGLGLGMAVEVRPIERH